MVVDVVDASNLERNLYLTTELLEIGRPVVLALNMTDVARDRGLRIDVARLAAKLGVPVVPTIGNKGEGMDELIQAITEVAISEANRPGPAEICGESSPDPADVAAVHPVRGHAMVHYGDEMEKAINQIESYAAPERPFAGGRRSS